jgi:ABC-type antimicrobial peptide transport system permease subunit
MGAGRRKLIAQFIGEALFMALLSAIVAVVIMAASLGSFNMLVQKNLLLELNNPAHWVALVMITCICGIVAGSYPSLYLSSFNPVFVLKGIKVKSGSAAWIRKGLVVTQFTVSIALIIATIIIFQQIQHIKDRNLGFNRNGLLELSMQGDMNMHYESIKQDLMQTGLVEYAGLADHPVIYGGNNTDGLAWQGKAPGSKILISWRSVDTDFFSTMDLKVIEGRNFYVTDTLNYENKSFRANAIITESLAKQMGKGTAIGKTIYDENDTLVHATIVGVVNDFVYGDMYGKPDPVIFFCTAPRFENTIYLRAKPGTNAEHLLSSIGAVIKKDNPAYPFEYRFVDDQFNDMFQTEMLMSKLSRVFAALAILISCLGLFGLAAYTAERRIKEIGIRKVLGATVASLAGLLSVEFLKLILLSLLLAFPLAWLAMHKWLQNYAYRVDIHWWVFIMAGVAAILIAIITVSFQAIRAAVSNPVQNLRTE